MSVTTRTSHVPPLGGVSRRTVIRTGGAGAGLWLLSTVGGVTYAVQASADEIPGGTLAPGDVDRFVTPLLVPPVMPRAGTMTITGGKNADYYEIGMRQFEQQILPPSMPATTVWGYGTARSRSKKGVKDFYNAPSLTIEAKAGRPVVVRWVNELVDESGAWLPHLLPVDPTLHWANPPGGTTMRDRHPHFDRTPGRYEGPVPIVTHVHGAHTTEESDGYPEAWYLPDAEVPDGYATTGTFYDYYVERHGLDWAPGTATFTYPNDQAATTLWYHDHALGLTRLNVYAGPAGFYLVRGGPGDSVLDAATGGVATLPGPAPKEGDQHPDTKKYREIPIVIQDRSFDEDGSLFYPDTRAFFDGFEGPFVPDTMVPPIWNPEFFGNMMMVNGRTWPYLDVDACRYRLRLLNGCDSRFLILQFDHPDVEVWQVGGDGGFLRKPVRLNDHPYDGSTGGGATLLLAPAERADVIVDFSRARGATFRLLNLGPDEPFGGGPIDPDGEEGFAPADPESTGLVMEFRVGSRKISDASTPPRRLLLPAPAELAAPQVHRDLSLNEHAHVAGDFDGPAAALLGTWDPATRTSTPMMWMDPITENPDVGVTEEWAVYNTTEDAHPVHVHQVQFEVVGRQALEEGRPVGEAQPPLPWETGPKDTVIAYPEAVTRFRLRFDTPGYYVWHCHILEHEDQEMMRPVHVGPIPPGAPAR